MREVKYAFYKELPGKNIIEAEESATVALKQNGFGVLTRIDVKATLKKKIDVDFKPYVILGACNPRLAFKTLSADDTVGLFLPCNVVIAETENGAEVAIIRAEEMFQAINNKDIAPMAEEANGLLKSAFEAM
jgi:uncharacterized protein (DUF302 family)